MAGEGQSYQNRIADLLDDTTVGNGAALPAAASETDNGHNGTPQTTPMVAPPAAASPVSPAPTSLPPAALPPAAGTPAESPNPAGKEDAGTLPPFLRQPPAGPDKGSNLPGTALFASAAKVSTPRAEQPPAQPPVQPTGTEPVLQPTTPAPSTPAAAAAASAAGEYAAQAAPQTGAPAVLAAAAAENTGAAGAEESAPSVEPATPSGPPISIKGRSDGLVIEIGKGSWSDILATLDDRLQQSASFFRNARVAVDLGARATTEAELQPLADLLKTHGLVLASVRTSTERTFQAALALGLTTTLESADGVPVADAAPASTNTSVGAYFVYRGYLRSGHRLQRKESVLVIGDVNPGAEVSSDGDVLVWGRLRGVAHAGAKGNTRAIVAALDLEPTQLRIADVMTIGPDPRPGQPGKWFWKRSANKRPEIARISNETISIEEWDATRPGGIVSLRRGG
jgi:septum site-determining protein MinC